ncbi:MAG: HEAT repeat domain-containing protein [Planctomycetes bacterium]|nr:HEAT repeat domain-containing protein [Planctomycetota bacterium]
MRCSRSIGGSVVLALAFVAGCAGKDPSPADADRELAAEWGDDEENADRLAGMLGDASKDELARAQAARSLGLIATGAGQAPALIKALSDPSPIVRHDAAETLGIHKVAEASGALEQMLAGDARDPVVDPRRAAAKALGGIRNRASVGPLVAALSDRDPGVARLAADSLRAITGQDFGMDRQAWAKWAAEHP